MNLGGEAKLYFFFLVNTKTSAAWKRKAEALHSNDKECHTFSRKFQPHDDIYTLKERDFYI